MGLEYTVVVETSSADETQGAGKALASCLEAADVVLLSGDLGAGKTQFVKGVASGLGAREVPTSPTFNIVLSYDSGRLPLHHFDLYRLDTLQQLEDINLREYLESGGVCFVEWAEKFPDAFDEFLSIKIQKTSDEGRVISASSCGERSAELLRTWKARLTAFTDQEVWCNSTAALDQGAFKYGQTPDRAEAGSGGSCLPNGEASVFGKTASDTSGPFVLAFDTANEVVALALGRLVEQEHRIEIVKTHEVRAHRASNTRLLPLVDAMMEQVGASRSSLVCVCVGRGPGSFTGVRIAMATAKGIAAALGVGLVGVSTLDAVAFNAYAHGVRGSVLVVADAMRKEVYPVYYDLTENGVQRLSADRVVKEQDFLVEINDDVLVMGDALAKYQDDFAGRARLSAEELWSVTGCGLLLAFEQLWKEGEADPLDRERHNPAFALPVYTRLSDAEENERARLALKDERDLVSGVQHVSPSEMGSTRLTMHESSPHVAPSDNSGVSYSPLERLDAGEVAALETAAMGSDAWSRKLVEDELGWKNRSWWVAKQGESVVGYAGGMVVDGDLQILKVAVSEQFRRQGIARKLLERVGDDARNLGASTCSLEVRVSNESARAFYESLGLTSVGVRPRYYSDREDALIMKGPVPTRSSDVAGMVLEHHEAISLSGTDCVRAPRPLILAIESSCDETAAAIVDGEGVLHSDVIASQIDFHARFGGVVPEIASRKHIEAICGVCDEALSTAQVLNGDAEVPRPIAWRDLDAVAVTYAPGLVGALVVGVAFAKGVSWALDIPLIGVNHLEGHLYANKIDAPDFEPPAVVSLVSGGNTILVHMRDWGDYVTLGSTIDDAVGEAFDKVAKALGLGYPGGPAISRQAEFGDPSAIPFPRALLHSHDLRFSLSGLKTAVVNYINSERQAGRELNIPNIAASFQQAVIDVQIAKAKAALEQTGAPTFCLGGGVAANPALRNAYVQLCEKLNVRLVMAPLTSCGDNAGMIALVALDRYHQAKFLGLDADAYAHADLDEPY